MSAWKESETYGQSLTLSSSLFLFLFLYFDGQLSSVSVQGQAMLFYRAIKSTTFSYLSTYAAITICLRRMYTYTIYYYKHLSGWIFILFCAKHTAAFPTARTSITTASLASSIYRTD